MISLKPIVLISVHMCKYYKYEIFKYRGHISRVYVYNTVLFVLCLALVLPGKGEGGAISKISNTRPKPCIACCTNSNILFVHFDINKTLDSLITLLQEQYLTFWEISKTVLGHF